MAYEETSGLYYDFKSGYYFDAERSLYYDGHSGTYYSYNYDTKSYEFHSQVHGHESVEAYLSSIYTIRQIVFFNLRQK
jgi:hypothetical protein